PAFGVFARDNGLRPRPVGLGALLVRRLVRQRGQHPKAAAIVVDEKQVIPRRQALLDAPNDLGFTQTQNLTVLFVRVRFVTNGVRSVGRNGRVGHVGRGRHFFRDDDRIGIRQRRRLLSPRQACAGTKNRRLPKSPSQTQTVKPPPPSSERFRRLPQCHR